MPDDVTWLCYGFGCARSRPTSQREQLCEVVAVVGPWGRPVNVACSDASALLAGGLWDGSRCQRYCSMALSQVTCCCWNLLTLSSRIPLQTRHPMPHWHLPSVWAIQQHRGVSMSLKCISCYPPFKQRM